MVIEDMAKVEKEYELVETWERGKVDRGGARRRKHKRGSSFKSPKPGYQDRNDEDDHSESYITCYLFDE